MHLHVVVLGPVVIDGYGSTPQVALVSVTSQQAGLPFDNACTLARGEHEFVERDSFVSYRHLRIDSKAHAERMVADKVWHPHVPCTAALLNRIMAGVCASRFTNGEYRRLFDCA